MKLFLKVCIPHTRRDYFDYHATLKELKVGMRVIVPFRNQTRIGLIVAVSNTPSSVKTKAIDSVIDDAPLLTDEMMNLCTWVSNYYQSPLSEVIPLALPKKYREGAPRQLPVSLFYSLTDEIEAAHKKASPKAKKQHELIDFIAHFGHPVAKSTLIKKGFAAQIKTLLDLKILKTHEQTILPVNPIEECSTPLDLHKEQKEAVETILEKINQFQCFLLQGVTGSGKTEVYLQVIAKVLALGQQVLILVPEIGLTPQLLARFSERFKEPMVVLHSNLNNNERQAAWQQAHDGLARLVIGTRSAVFTPMPDLGLIVIDEEHDASLKQMDGVRYSARETALMRAHTANIPIVLGSATPSLESLYNCERGKFILLKLTHKAISTIPLHYQILDVRNKALQHGLAEPALNQIKKHLQQGNQVLVFINRRGFAPVLLCHQCGWMADCRHCDSHLTLHQRINKMLCHHCGLAQTIPMICKSCQSTELIPVGAGTQRVHEFLSAHFPEYTVLRVDRDEVARKHALNERLAQISSGDAQLIVGTQMLAKGHHFPRLSLVVILDADNGFYNQDFRALERLGQLLIQVAGRAGRAEHAGNVVIQTHAPQHPLLNVLVQQGYETFAEVLLEQRKLSGLPPFQHLALIRAQGKSLPKVLQFLHQVKEKLNTHDLQTLGPAPAPLARKAGFHRVQLLLKASSRKTLQTTLTALREWLIMANSNSGVRWNVDVDPVDLS